MSADYAFNDKGIKFTSTGKNNGWGGTSNGNGYPFIINNGKMYGTTKGMGHSGFVVKELLPNTQYGNYNKRQMKNELTINNRNVSICGRLFPHINTDGSSVITFYNADNVHNLDNQKMLGALIKLVGDYFKIEPSSIYYHIGNGKEQYKCSYKATERDVQNLLKHTINLAQNSNQKNIDDNFKSVDSTIFDTYADKPYSELTTKEKEMFHNLRNRNDIKDRLQGINKNFTDAQWNNMRTIGDSIIRNSKIIRITEEQYNTFINCKDIIKEDVYINNLNDKNKTASLTYIQNHSKRNVGNKTSADMLKTDKMDANNTDTYIVPLKGGINSYNITSINGTEVMHYFKEKNAFIEINKETYKLNMDNKEVNAFMKQFISKVERVTEWQLNEFRQKNKDIKYTTVSIYPVPSHSNFNRTMANTLTNMSISGMKIQVINDAILHKNTSNLQRDNDFIEKNKEYYSQLQNKNMPERGTHIQNIDNTMNKLTSQQKTKSEIVRANSLVDEIIRIYNDIISNILTKRGRRPTAIFAELRQKYDEYVESCKKIRELGQWDDVITGTKKDRKIVSLANINNIDDNEDNKRITFNVINLLKRFGYGKGLTYNIITNGNKESVNKSNNTEILRKMDYRNFQIKTTTNDVRMGLKNYFQQNNEYDKCQEEIDKAKGTLIVIFDDNVSGGATLADICYQLSNLGLSSLVPITFGQMRESWNINQNVKIDKPVNGWNF